MKHALNLLPVIALLLSASMASAQQARPLQSDIRKHANEAYPALFELYKHLHANPELSFQEENTSRLIAAELGKAGFEVTPKVGGHGVVAVLRNGSGPTVLVRADMDALPVKEETGLPYASKATAVDEKGTEVSVMHACGHDVHMTVLAGVAKVLKEMKSHWQGTLVLIAQPAEERVSGAKAMLEDGLYKRFPVPDYALALHVASDMPAGTVGYTEGFALANSDAVDIVIKGVGGHGAAPHSAKDPIVLAAQIVLALQTIVSRELDPLEPAVVTVGSIHGGTKHNIIPDEVRLQLTIRSYSDTAREQTIEGIKRISRNLALAAGLPEELLPQVSLAKENAKATYNDPALTRQIKGILEAAFGAENVLERKPVMGAEDFGLFGRTEHKVPICMFRLGTVSAEVFKRSMAAGKGLPSLHSPFFAPDPEPTIKTGVVAMTAAVLDLLRPQQAAGNEIIGIGIVLGYDAEIGAAKAVWVVQGSPAARGGVRPGQVITKVDGASVVGKSIEESVELIRGPAGSKVTLELVDPGQLRTVTVELTRERISVPTLEQRQ